MVWGGVRGRGRRGGVEAVCCNWCGQRVEPAVVCGGTGASECGQCLYWWVWPMHVCCLLLATGKKQ